jgi:predicted RNA-binding protein YlqC (UPF0109 family)
MAAFWSRKNKESDEQQPALPEKKEEHGQDRTVSEMKEFIEFIARSLVDYPEEVEVKRIDGEKTMVFELRVNKSDIGKIIGKNGRTIRAIRTLLTTTAAKHGQRAVLEILE